MTNKLITDRMLEIERVALDTDKTMYLECLNNKPLTERNDKQEIRDGCILFWNVYCLIRNINE